MYFLNSVEEYLKKDGKLSVKQRKALNTMYKRFEKRVDKILKKGSGK
jgi:late competence protein required for DNA uptake (superfamily II DNA/RNA helicase)